MDFSPAVVSDDQGHAAAASTDHVPISSTSLGRIVRWPSSELYNDFLDFDFASSEAIFIDDVLYNNGLSEQAVIPAATSPTAAENPPGAAQLHCEHLIYSSFPALREVYIPPLSGEVVELQSEPPISPQPAYSYGFHDQAKHTDCLPRHNALHDETRLADDHPPYPLQSSVGIEWRTPSASPTADAYDGSSGTMSFVHLNSIFSPGPAHSEASPAMEMSSASAPAALPTSKFSLDQTFELTEDKKVAKLDSPTSSVNTGERIRRRGSCSDTFSQVAIIVKDPSLYLDDGFGWKKYGEKDIKGSKFKRSYFKCDEVTRRGCKIVKRVQRCDDEQKVCFTYIGRHNHN